MRAACYLGAQMLGRRDCCLLPTGRVSEPPSQSLPGLRQTSIVTLSRDCQQLTDQEAAGPLVHADGQNIRGYGCCRDTWLGIQSPNVAKLQSRLE